MASDGVVHFDKVSLELGGRPVLRDLELTVEPGETLVLLGRSGSGKTSALRMINAMLRPSAGTVSVDGKDVQLRVHPDVGRMLKSNQNKYLEELEEVLRRPVLVRSDPSLHHEKFDLA